MAGRLECPERTYRAHQLRPGTSGAVGLVIGQRLTEDTPPMGRARKTADLLSAELVEKIAAKTAALAPEERADVLYFLVDELGYQLDLAYEELGIADAETETEAYGPGGVATAR